MTHDSTAVQKYSERLDELVCQMSRCHHACLHYHWIITEIVINTDTVRNMMIDMICNPISSVTTSAKISVHIVRQLHLEEVGCTAFTIPLHLIMQIMFSRPTVHCHIITIDY